MSFCARFMQLVTACLRTDASVQTSQGRQSEHVQKGPAGTRLPYLQHCQLLVGNKALGVQVSSNGWPWGRWPKAIKVMKHKACLTHPTTSHHLVREIRSTNSYVTLDTKEALPAVAYHKERDQGNQMRFNLEVQLLGACLQR